MSEVIFLFFLLRTLLIWDCINLGGNNAIHPTRSDLLPEITTCFITVFQELESCMQNLPKKSLKSSRSKAGRDL